MIWFVTIEETLASASVGYELSVCSMKTCDQTFVTAFVGIAPPVGPSFPEVVECINRKCLRTSHRVAVHVL